MAGLGWGWHCTGGCGAAPHKQDDMICLNNCIPGPVYPLSTERTVSQSCIGAGHEGGSVRGTVTVWSSGTWSPSCRFLLWVLSQIFIVFLLRLFQVVRKMMWLMDHVFKYTNFGLVSLIHGDFFIRQVRDSFVCHGYRCSSAYLASCAAGLFYFTYLLINFLFVSNPTSALTAGRLSFLHMSLPCFHKRPVNQRCLLLFPVLCETGLTPHLPVTAAKLVGFSRSCRGILWEGWQWTLVREGCSALLGRADPSYAGAAGTEQLALTGLHIRPTGFTSAVEFLEYHASLGGWTSSSSNDSHS